MHDQLVARPGGARHHLARGRHDHRIGERRHALLGAALGDAHHPGAVLIGAGLHRELVVEPRMLVVVGRRRVVQRRVVPQHHHLDVLQAHHAIGLGPAPVVADAHAHVAAERLEHRKAEIADLEVALLQMLERPLGLVLAMAGQVDLAVLAGDAAILFDDDRGVETARPAVLAGELGVAEAHAQAEPLGLVEQRCRFVVRHLALEEGIDLGLVGHPPAREERGQGELGEHHQLAAHAARFAEMRDHALDHVAPRVAALDRAHLRRADCQKPGHRHSAAIFAPLKAGMTSRAKRRSWSVNSAADSPSAQWTRKSSSPGYLASIDRMPSMTSPGVPQNQAFCFTPSRIDGILAGAPGVPQVRPCSSA